MSSSTSFSVAITNGPQYDTPHTIIEKRVYRRRCRRLSIVVWLLLGMLMDGHQKMPRALYGKWLVNKQCAPSWCHLAAHHTTATVTFFFIIEIVITTRLFFFFFLLLFWYLYALQTAYLEVVIPPDIVSEEGGGEVLVPEGGSARLSCKARGFPQPRVTWRREDGSDIILRSGGASVGSNSNGHQKSKGSLLSPFFFFKSILLLLFYV